MFKLRKTTHFYLEDGSRLEVPAGTEVIILRHGKAKVLQLGNARFFFLPFSAKLPRKFNVEGNGIISVEVPKFHVFKLEDQYYVRVNGVTKRVILPNGPPPFFPLTLL